jgi:exosortase B
VSAVLKPSQGLVGNRLSPFFQWLPILAGLAVLYVPTYYRLANGLWTSEDNIHGPIVLAVVIWAVWEKRNVLIGQSLVTSLTVGWPIFVVGLLFYIVGRSQEIIILEVGSQIPILAGILLLFRGKEAVHKLWFPLLFLVFMLPLPSFVVDSLTGPLKQNISAMVENLLYGFDYPIARSGVVLSIGPYQLLVADACSGLNSMISLTTMGLLYLYLMNHCIFRQYVARRRTGIDYLSFRRRGRAGFLARLRRDCFVRNGIAGTHCGRFGRRVVFSR